MRRLLAVLSLGSVALLAACTGGTGGTESAGSTEQATPQVSTQVVTSVVETVTAEAPLPETTTQVAPTQPSQSTPQQDCSTDVYASDFGPMLERGIVPLGQLGEQTWQVEPVPDWFYHFQVKEDGYDACQPLSYVSLAGSNGDAERSAGIGSAIADTIVFFHYGELITHPAPFEMKTVENVSRISGSELQVEYGHAGGATAEGVTEYYTLNFFYDDGLSASGELPESVDSHMRLYLL